MFENILSNRELRDERNQRKQRRMEKARMQVERREAKVVDPGVTEAVVRQRIDSHLLPDRESHKDWARSRRAKPRRQPVAPKPALSDSLRAATGNDSERFPRRERFRIDPPANARVNPAIVSEDAEHAFADLAVVDNQSLDEADDFVDLVVGFDFGTAYTKVVVQEPASGRAWAVPLGKDPSNPFIVSSLLYLNEDTYDLLGNGQTVTNLKTPFLVGEGDEDTIVDGIAFLTLVLRQVKGWIAREVLPELPGAPVWSFNLGLPAKNLEESSLVSQFERMLICAALLSEESSQELDRKLVFECLMSIKELYGASADAYQFRDSMICADQVHVFPEFAAQIIGYLKSDSWDRTQPKFLMVDIGGGTVDASIFNVTTPGGDLRFSVFSSGVEKLGAYLLHRKRLEWLKESMSDSPSGAAISESLADLLDRAISPAKVPSTVDDYIQGVQYLPDSVDYRFEEAFVDLVLNRIVNLVKAAIDPGSRQWPALPLLFCGGGKGLPVYRHLVDRVNGTPNSSVGFRETSMPKPRKLFAEGLRSDEYQRLSVAYGLSFEEIGEVYTPDQIEDLYIPPPRTGFGGPSPRNKYISKEDV